MSTIPQSYCFIAVRHKQRQVLLHTSLEVLSKVSDVEMIGKYPLLWEHGWGASEVIASEKALELGYSFWKKDPFYLKKDYPNYSDIEF